MDLKKEGLEMFFRDYQIAILQTLWKNPSMNSRSVWQQIEGISRASVINFLNAMVDEGLLTCVERSAKGGYHGVYSSKFDENGTREYLKKLVQEKLKTL
jgi:predicted transcriptional regulator